MRRDGVLSMSSNLISHHHRHRSRLYTYHSFHLPLPPSSPLSVCARLGRHVDVISNSDAVDGGIIFRSACHVARSAELTPL